MPANNLYIDNLFIINLNSHKSISYYTTALSHNRYPCDKDKHLILRPVHILNTVTV